MLHAAAHRQAGKREIIKGAGKRRMLKVGSGRGAAVRLQRCSLRTDLCTFCGGAACTVCCLAWGSSGAGAVF